MKPIGGEPVPQNKKPFEPEPRLEIPTNDYQHVSWIREGRQSAEVFCRDNDRRHELGLAPILRELD